MYNTGEHLGWQYCDPTMEIWHWVPWELADMDLPLFEAFEDGWFALITGALPSELN